MLSRTTKDKTSTQKRTPIIIYNSSYIPLLFLIYVYVCVFICVPVSLIFCFVSAVLLLFLFCILFPFPNYCYFITGSQLSSSPLPSLSSSVVLLFLCVLYCAHIQLVVLIFPIDVFVPSSTIYFLLPLFSLIKWIKIEHFKNNAKELVNLL